MKELQDSEVEEIKSINYDDVVQSLRFVKGDMYEDASNNILVSQVRMKKYYDIHHSRNFEFQVGDKVLKMVCKNIGRKGGKQEPKFTGLYEIVSISKLGVDRLKTERGCDLKTGVPIRQLQKYNHNKKNTE